MIYDEDEARQQIDEDERAAFREAVERSLDYEY